MAGLTAYTKSILSDGQLDFFMLFDSSPIQSIFIYRPGTCTCKANNPHALSCINITIFEQSTSLFDRVFVWVCWAPSCSLCVFYYFSDSVPVLYGDYLLQSECTGRKRKHTHSASVVWWRRVLAATVLCFNILSRMTAKATCHPACLFARRHNKI